MNPRRWLPVRALFCLVCLMAYSWACYGWADNPDIDPDLVLWTPISLAVPVNERLRINTNYLGWYNHNVSQNNVQFVEVMPAYRLKPWLVGSVGVRYVNIPSIQGHQWGAIQQLEASHPLGIANAKVTHRVRLEELHERHEAGNGLWGRYRVNVQVPLPRTNKWVYESNGELILTLKGEPWLPSGNQWLYVQQKLGYKVTDWLTVKGGYMLSWQQRDRAVDTLSHVVLAEAVLVLPTGKGNGPHWFHANHHHPSP